MHSYGLVLSSSHAHTLHNRKRFPARPGRRTGGLGGPGEARPAAGDGSRGSHAHTLNSSVSPPSPGTAPAASATPRTALLVDRAPLAGVRDELPADGPGAGPAAAVNEGGEEGRRRGRRPGAQNLGLGNQDGALAPIKPEHRAKEVQVPNRFWLWFQE